MDGSKTKSLFIVIGSFLSLILIVVGIAAAVVGIKQKTCEHVWGDGEVKVEATCVEEGELVYVCELCNKKQSEPIEKISHKWLHFTTKLATCTENGHKAYTICEICEEYKEGSEFKEIKAVGHLEVDDVAVAATCTEPGLTAGKHCKVCGEVTLKQVETPALNHNIVTVEAIAPTCTKTGLTAWQKCARCDTVYVGFEEIPAMEHSNKNGDELCDTCGVSAVRRITSADEVTVGKWYRFYIDTTNPNSEAYITFNLIRGDGGFDGWYKEVGTDLSVDLPQITIGISSGVTGGYIYWGEDGSERLQVDATIVAGENYIDIYFQEGRFHATSDGVNPEIYFELTSSTEVLEVFSSNGGYVAVLDETILGYEL